MTKPIVFDEGVCPFGFRQDLTMTDYNTFLTNISTELVTNRGWTNPSSNLYQCPADSGGRWIDILFTRITATDLECRVRDQLGRTLCTRRIQIAVAGTNVNYYTGKFYCIIESLQTTSEIFQAMITEPSPDGESDMAFCSALGTGYRTTADVVDGIGDQPGEYFGWEDTAAANRQRLQTSVDTGNVAIPFILVSGNLMYEPVVVDNLVAGVARWIGQLYQSVICDSSIAFQADKTVMIDDAVSATFRVIGLATINTNRMMVRKA